MTMSDINGSGITVTADGDAVTITVATDGGFCEWDQPTEVQLDWETADQLGRALLQIADERPPGPGHHFMCND